MSLPTYARFYDKDGKEIGIQFINVGWIFSPEYLAREIANLADIYDAVEFQVYGYTFPISLLRESKNLSELINKIDKIISEKK